MLLAILLMMALMIIVATYYTAPAMVQQIKRDREEEMIHRGTEYARAIKKFYKKNGRYPANLDDLDKGQIRFLRKRYKDPLTKDGKWKLLNYGDIAMLLNAAGPGTPAAALANQGGTLTPGGAIVPGVPSPGGAQFSGVQQQQFQQQPGSINGFSTNTGQGFSPPGGPGGGFGFNNNTDQGNNSAGAGQSGGNQNPGFTFVDNSQNPFGSSQPGSSPFAQATPGPNTQFGGGAIVGVASMSKEKTIRIYNKKKTYDEWQFIYNPMMDQTNVLLRGPYQPTTIGGAQIGTPAGQLNGQQPNGQSNPFSQQPGGFGQQPGGFGQQPGALPPQFQPQQPGSNPPGPSPQ
jgi:type II secretory pathway pseudopilin PulG